MPKPEQSVSPMDTPLPPEKPAKKSPVSEAHPVITLESARQKRAGLTLTEHPVEVAETPEEKKKKERDIARQEKIRKVFLSTKKGEERQILVQSEVLVSLDERVRAAELIQDEKVFEKKSSEIQQAVEAPFRVNKGTEQIVFPAKVYTTLESSPGLQDMMNKILGYVSSRSSDGFPTPILLAELVRHYPYPQKLESFLQEEIQRDFEKEVNTPYEERVSPTRNNPNIEMERALGDSDITRQPAFEAFMALIYGRRQDYWRNLKILREKPLSF